MNDGKFRALLKERGITHQQLSAMTGIPTSTIGVVASGHQSFSPERGALIAEALAVPVEQLGNAVGHHSPWGQMHSAVTRRKPAVTTVHVEERRHGKETISVVSTTPKGEEIGKEVERLRLLVNNMARRVATLEDRVKELEK